MACVDQSTQVNFPLTIPINNVERKKRLQRYNTSQDLWLRPNNNTSLVHTFKTHNKSVSGGTLNRPRSMILQNGGSTSIVNSLKPYSIGGTITPDTSSVSLDSAASLSKEAFTSPPSSFCQEVICLENGRRWNGPIAAYNVAKVWKSNATLNTQYLPQNDDGSTLKYNRFDEIPLCGGCQCQNTIEPPSYQKMKDCTKDDAQESLSWRRLHMSRAKLKATATTSELLSGFAMVAMVELQINEPTKVPEWLFVMFSVCTTVLVAVHIFALMISTYLLPNIDAVSKLEVANLVHESPHERMRGFIELAWAFSTVFGLFLFLVEVAILCWVKFWDFSFTAAIAATIIVIPVLCIFIAFAIHFYHSLVIQKCENSVYDMKELEDMKRQLDNATNNV